MGEGALKPGPDRGGVHASRAGRASSLSLWRLTERTLVRDPWVWALVPLYAVVGLGFAGRSAEVALVSLYAVAQLAVPPLVLALVAQRLAGRDGWALWAPMMPRPGVGFVAAALGAAMGLAWPTAFATLVGASIAGAPPQAALALVLAVVLTVLLWSLVAALFAALTLDATRSMAGGLALWVVSAIVYEPALVAFAVMAAAYPFERAFAVLLLINPGELGRVALVRALDVPVFAGPSGVLVARWLGSAPLLWAFAASLAWTALLALAAGARFARRER